jgi:hypothetical protein
MAKQIKVMTTTALQPEDLARQLVRKVQEFRQLKKEADEEIKHALIELEQLADDNPSWFEHEETGTVLKSCNLGAGKLVWKKSATVYEFETKEDLETIFTFATKYPKSIDFKLKAMQNIELDEFGIVKHEGKVKLDVE